MRTSSQSTSTLASTPSARLAGLATFWFGIQALWGALLGISVQARVTQLAGTHALVFYGWVATSGAMLAACTQLVVGPLSDRRRRAGSRRVEFYIAGALLGSAGLFAFYRAPSVTLLVAAYALLQVGLNVAIGPYQAAIPDAVPSSAAGRASSWMAALQSSGNAAGAVLATVLANGTALAAALAALLLSTCAVTAREVETWPAMNAVAAAPLRFSRAFALLFASRLALFAGFYTLLGYMFFYTIAFVDARPASARTIDGVLVLGFTVFGACGAALAARPADRYDRRGVAAAGAICAVAALALFVAGHGIAAVVAAIVLGGAGWGCFLVADWAIACRVIPRHAAAGAMAIWNLAVLAPQVLAPLITTLVVTHAPGGLRSHVTIAFALAGLEMLIGISLLRGLPAGVARE